MCKFCGKEYQDKENFNWSCRTHTYEFSGEMWWCCGKRGKDQPGCKYGKHESKEDDDDDDLAEAKAKNQLKAMKTHKCNCCKEVGHLIEHCPKDPNLRTNEKIAIGMDRILRITDNRKLFADTAVITTHLLKKCVKVPKLTNEEELIIAQVTTPKTESRGSKSLPP